ncbi:MAG: histidine kinase, partial [Pseudomonadota bacterium]
VLMRHLPPVVALVLTAAIGIGAGVIIGSLLVVKDSDTLFEGYATPILGLFFGTLGILFFQTQERLKESRTRLAEAESERLTREKVFLETELKLLQAQIEPHFLFNTLSNVIGMIREDPAAAESTLLRLTTLLRSSLQRTRKAVITLDDELTIIEALLAINGIRMGKRLSWRIDVDAELRTLPIPPMLLQPLVENAVKHGIEPLEAGGEITVSASASEQTLTVRISDVGNRPTTNTRNGGYPAEGFAVGIANVQARLAALFGDAARLSLTENSPSGTVATLTLPVNRATEAIAANTPATATQS